MKILVAEDDAVCRRFLELILQRLGHTVKACADGYQAWRAYEAEDFNVVVSDWMMPVLDGLDLCRTIRKLNRSDYCYFIMSTSRDSSADILEAKNAGVDDYVTKPLHKSEMASRIEQAQRVLAYMRPGSPGGNQTAAS